MGKILNAFQKLIGGLNTELDDVRRQIADIQGQLETLAARPCDAPTTKRRVDFILAKLQKEFFDRHFKTMAVNSGEWQERDAGVDLREVDFSSARTHAALYPDQLRAAMLKAAEAGRAGRPEGITPGEREAQEKALKTKLLGLEKIEEGFICEASKAGVQIARRPDASPEAIIGVPE